MTFTSSPREQPIRCGIGLRTPHLAEVMARRPRTGWLEVHPENYMGAPAAADALERLRADYPLSLHGVGLSLGSADGIDADHLSRLKALTHRLEPCRVSEHMSWSAHGGAWLNDLVPLPYTDESLSVICRNVDRMQTALGRQILVENPSSYLSYRDSTMPEAVFLAEIVRRTGCGILCDVNNIFVSAHNLGLDAQEYMRTLPADAIGEIHLAGHARNEIDGQVLLIDDHGGRVIDPVRALYRDAVERFGPVPTMIEWDTALPPLDVLLDEAALADAVMEVRHARAA
nr:DUF692 domain-containing protein [uncultured Rhodopila sp.]